MTDVVLKRLWVGATRRTNTLLFYPFRGQEVHRRLERSNDPSDSLTTHDSLHTSKCLQTITMTNSWELSPKQKFLTIIPSKIIDTNTLTVLHLRPYVPHGVYENSKYGFLSSSSFDLTRLPLRPNVTWDNYRFTGVPRETSTRPVSRSWDQPYFPYPEMEAWN